MPKKEDTHIQQAEQALEDYQARLNKLGCEYYLTCRVAQAILAGKASGVTTCQLLNTPPLPLCFSASIHYQDDLDHQDNPDMM